MKKSYRNSVPYKHSLMEALKDPAEAAAYLEAAFVDEDESGFLMALRNVAEAHGIANVAEQTGLGRESLYKTLSEDGNPKLRTLTALLHAVGLRIAFEPEKNRRAVSAR